MKDFRRPLRITHGYFGYREEDEFEEKVRKIEARVKELKEKGFGGIVTNVSDFNYLHNDTEWKLMKEKERICRENGMRMWLYDEKGYPSGGAWKETLTAHPEYEARSLVAVCEVIGPGEEKIFRLPYGHESTVNVVGYEMEGERVPDETLDKGPVVFGRDDETKVRNDGVKKMLVIGFYVKRAFEGAHCQNNVCASRRYIDVSSEEAVGEFIANTYRRYVDCLKGSFAAEIGDERSGATVEAIFTDEPSYMGHYINRGINTPCIDHEPDPDIPLYPVINWGIHFEEKFRERYGYEIGDSLAYLFTGGSRKARQVRRDFHSLASKLFEKSFFEQIGKYCEANGLMFSGHVLLEDELKLHVRFEGNIMRFLSHMHVPGIDMLHSVPEIVRANAFTPILARSAAALYGRKHVMDEVSAHAQGGNVTEAQVECSLMLQLALGADVFTSYYQDNAYTPEFWRNLNEGISKASEAIGDRDTGRALIYYPVDTVMCLQKPGAEFDNAPSEQDLIDKCQADLEKAMNLLTDSLIPFIFADPEGLSEALAREPELVIIPGCLITDEAEAYIRSFSGKANVVYFDPEEAFESQYGKAAFAGAALLTGQGAAQQLCESGNFAKLRRGLPAGGLEAEAPGVVAAYGRGPNGARTALLVNSASTEARIRSCGAGALAPFGAAPLHGYSLAVAVEEEGFSVTLPPYGTAVLTWPE